MATFSTSINTPTLPNFTRTIQVDDGVWADVLNAIRETKVPKNDGTPYSEEECSNFMLREFVEMHLARAQEYRSSHKLTFDIIA